MEIAGAAKAGAEKPRVVVGLAEHIARLQQKRAANDSSFARRLERDKRRLTLPGGEDTGGG